MICGFCGLVLKFSFLTISKSLSYVNKIIINEAKPLMVSIDALMLLKNQEKTYPYR